jgi:excisionase family DNA binding protein
MLKKPKNEIYRMARDGRIGCIRDGDSVRFMRKHVEEYIAQHEHAKSKWRK